MSDLERTKIDGDRHYLVDGSPYPSVTTVTGKHPEKRRSIDEWERRVGSKEADRIKNEAATLGTIVHHRILNEYAARPLPRPEVDFKWMYDGIETDVETCVSMWNKLDFDVEPMPYIEERVVSHEYGYAGTFDMMTNGTVVDLKTSPAVRGSHRWQIAAYHHAVEELSQYPDPEDAAIIKLHPDPAKNNSLTASVERLDRDEIDAAFGVFTELLDEYF